MIIFSGVKLSGFASLDHVYLINIIEKGGVAKIIFCHIPKIFHNFRFFFAELRLFQKSIFGVNKEIKDIRVYGQRSKDFDKLINQYR